MKRFFLLLLVLVFQCNPYEPNTVKSGERKCDHCHMMIVDLKFDAQLVTEKGKKFFFDSIECLAQFELNSSEKAKKQWVKNFKSTQDWIETQDAIFLHSKDLPSPMGGNLSAYRDESVFLQIQKEKGGDRLQWSDVEKLYKTK